MNLRLAEALAAGAPATRVAGIRGGLTKARKKLERERHIVDGKLYQAQQYDVSAAEEFEDARQHDPDDVRLLLELADQATKERVLGLIGAYPATP
jgi:hypothetical protein